jgi:hypothetical protein
MQAKSRDGSGRSGRGPLSVAVEKAPTEEIVKFDEGEGVRNKPLNDEEVQDGASPNDDEAIRMYIRKHIKKSGGISTENVRKTFGIGWIRAKRLHDQEMGLKTDEVRYASDEKLRRYIRSCFDEKGSCSVNHLRQEFNVGYNRAKKILDEEKERAECTPSIYGLAFFEWNPFQFAHHSSSMQMATARKALPRYTAILGLLFFLVRF